MLQDRHGVISLDVPVTGRLDDPKFKLGPIILQVFMNILTKAATKPFALLGSMFGGGEDLDFIAFELGRADFATGELNKLDTLATALEDRPALHLGINGSVDPVKDREALARIKIEQNLKQARLQELAAAGQKVASIENVLLEPPDRERLLKLAYAEAAGLVSARASGSRKETVLAHLEAHQNFRPLHPAAKPTAFPVKRSLQRAALTVADMEKFLIEKTEVTPAEFRGADAGTGHESSGVPATDGQGDRRPSHRRRAEARGRLVPGPEPRQPHSAIAGSPKSGDRSSATGRHN